jgi:hypothetical protein
VKEYDVYLPLSYNDGTPVPAEKIRQIKKLLLDRFGGLTHFPQENEGLWKLGQVTFRDKIIVLRVLSDDEDGASKFFSSFRQQTQRELAQAELLIIEREVRTIV